MKEATGELSVTVITVVAIAAVATLFYTLVWPAIQQSIAQNTCNTMGSNYWAVKTTGSEADKALDQSNATKQKYKCCKGATKAAAQSSTDCLGIN